MQKILFLICFLFIAIVCKGQDSSQILELPIEEEIPQSFDSKKWHLGLGNYFDLPSTYQVTSSGDKNGYSLWPILNWGRTYQGYFYSHFLFQWNLLLSIPRDVGSSDLTRTLLAFDFLLGQRVNYLGSFSVGISFFQQILVFKQSGDTQTEGNNDAGKFYRPNRAVIVSQQALILAYATPVLLRHYVIEAKSYIFSLWEKEKSEMSYALNVSYQW